VDGPKLAPDVPRFKRARDLVFRVVLLTNAVELPQYHEIMDADSAIRAEWVPPSTVHSNQDAQIVGLNRAFIVIPLRAMGKPSPVFVLHQCTYMPFQSY
jgi:hypothetical protein